MMNIPRLLLCLLLLAVAARAQAPNSGAPPPTEPAPADVQGWIATTDSQWRATLKREVTDLDESERGKAKTQYLASLDAALAKATAAGDL